MWSVTRYGPVLLGAVHPDERLRLTDDCASLPSVGSKADSSHSPLDSGRQALALPPLLLSDEGGSSVNARALSLWQASL